ncbi:MAG: SDR family NAD(P)-dependent oxidoreductase [Hyalangium sp.]|uniref:SDR family NAD(P)-dependent oxidoreductase n=1 Tax=Hyalangium sp. TaxID=2028555 RepID=UPI00389A76B2
MATAVSGKTFVVTGATGSVGKAAATELARLGTVVLVARDKARGEQAVAEVRRASGNEAVELALADFESLSSVRALSEELRRRHPKIDVLVNNAAIVKRERSVTKDGFETMFAVNHLAPFLLTRLLLPALEAAAPGRVITVSAPSDVALDFGDLQSEKAFSWFRVFGASKMCNLLFSFELARRVDPSKVISHVVHPGLVKSSLLKEAPGLLNFLVQLVSGKPDSAAKGIAWLATAPEGAKESGKFWKGQKHIKAAPYSQVPGNMERLWTESARLVGV